ncbi:MULTISPECIES: tetratricopeptide repeat protein [unclassified Phenylobacterium]|uniref:tetratricopeptide repeat protein n=1 Tax=unclassified Phenylobacterium TaxID=2640670 RepID=UPI00083B3B13|nr:MULTISPECIES: tetratricopeptide repeat protein [unclassified Phenylobacterium]
MNSPAFWGEQAKAHARDGEYARAETALRQGLQRHPGHPVLGYALAILLLARGDYAAGWPLYEDRLRLAGARAPTLSFAQWRGEPVDSLLVLPEQGFGDQIMFARYIRPLLARGIRVTVVAPQALARLYQPLGAEVLAMDGDLSVPTRDAWCMIGSLPGLVSTLPTDPWVRARGRGGGRGVMLRGSGRYPHRDLSPEAVAALEGLGLSLSPEATGARDFQDTAEIIAGLDHVITVDTAVAHLAGSLGAPTWLLLPTSADWRWGRTESTSAWYPSMRLFRQRVAGDWTGVVDEVRTELARTATRQNAV